MPLNKSTIDRFMALFNENRPDVDALMEECYSSQVLFRDPLVERRGRKALARYLKDAYANVIRCEFDYGEPVRGSRQVTIPWTMTLEHRRLARGAPIHVDGITLLQGDTDSIEYHRDYYDAGQLIYENVPLLGSVIRWIRRQAA
ncbi:SnoaL-like protein [Halospina denitrificans]|uniref:SnoaL-like protein n=1 Tax=Halospina denitrificans TaxID=332522 RepID=A0A4R7JSX8_9GAMM|nr:nuclear transport factor 2 family protein [Halospina denitrificans]TDT41401.1 SnoaL-like protein [Halospina denitrificans]